MKFQLNHVAVLLAASTFAAPTAAARLKHPRPREGEGEGDLKLKNKKSLDELDVDGRLPGRRLADDVDADAIANIEAESSEPEPELDFLRGKNDDKDPLCYIGQKFLDKLAEDPDTNCCDMPEFYYTQLESVADIKTSLTQAGCTVTRPACYSTGTQITYWQLQSISEPDGVTHYPVCKGAVISPGELMYESTVFLNLDQFLLGFLDSPVFVAIPMLQLKCEGDCILNGGQYQFLSTLEVPLPDGTSVLVEDISGLTIEGFTFTGTMENFSVTSSAISIHTPGDNISIKGNAFKDTVHPTLGDGIGCGLVEGYSAVRVGPSWFLHSFGLGPETLEVQVTIENNVFQNIDTGTYPVYANNPKECNFCYEETKATYHTASLIENIGQEVNLVGNTFKKVVAQDLYFARPISDCTTPDLCYKGSISGNDFNKNSVNALFTLMSPDLSDVSFVGNEGECKQRYTGGMYCPVRRYEDNNLGNLSFSPFTSAIFVCAKKGIYEHVYPHENCDGSKFCYTENVVSCINNWIHERNSANDNVCGTW